MIKFSSAVLRNIYRNVKPMSLTTLINRKFATPAKPTAIADFTKKLQEEIQYQNENPPDFTEQNSFLEKNGWKKQSYGTLNELTKQVGDKTIHVTYLARSPQPEQPQQEKQQGQEDQQTPDYCEFTVYVQRGNSSQYMFADFLTSDGELTISSLSFTNDYKTHRNLNRFQRSGSIYQGPDLESLDEAVVDGLHSYFESLGIDEQLVTFVEQNSLDQEHSFYVKWLGDVKRFVQ